MTDVRGLTAVDGAGTEVKEAPRLAGHVKVERAASAGDDCVEHPQWIFGVELRARVSGGVNDMTELAIREIKILDVSAYEGEAGMLDKVRGLLPERVNASGQNRGLQPKAKASSGMAKTLQQPAANEAGASGNEEASAIKARQVALRESNDSVELLSERANFRHCGRSPQVSAPNPLRVLSAS
jgi:hypothetical protein